MKKIFLLLVTSILITNAFAAFNGSNLPMSSGTGALVVATGTRTTVLSGTTVISTVQTLPFSFTLDGNSYTRMIVSQDGWVRLGTSATMTANAEPSNSITSGNNLPKLAPLWDDLDFPTVANGGGAFVFTNGTSPNRQLVVEWVVNVPLAGTSIGKFQMVLHEGTNSIQYIYNGMSSGSMFASYSIGMTKTSTNYASVTMAATPTISYNTANNNNTVNIPNNMVLTFTPTANLTYSSGLTFSSVSQTSMTVSYTAGNTGNRIVLCRAANAITDLPTNYTTYTANSNYGSGSLIGSSYVVYNGSATSFNLTGLTAGVTYYVRVIDQNSSGSNVTYLTSQTLNSSQATTNNSPSSNLASSNVMPKSMTLTFTAGSGSNHLVLCQAGSAVTALPSNNTSYTASTTYGSGSSISGAYVVYNGTGNTFDLTGLSESTTYYFRIVEQNGTGASATFISNLPYDANKATTSVTAPTNMSFSNLNTSSMTMSFNAGNGTNRIVLCQSGTSVGSNPTDLTSYTANTTYGSGSQIGSAYVVYSGTGNSVTVSGLTQSTNYTFRVIEQFGSGATSQYITSKALNGTQSTIAPKPSTGSTVSSPGTSTSNSLSYTITKGNGQRRMVVCQKDSDFVSDPQDGHQYSSNSEYGKGEKYENGYVIYDGVDDHFNVTSLESGKKYKFMVVEYNGTGGSCSYDKDHKLKFGDETNVSAPTSGTTGGTFSSIKSNEIEITFTKGNGDRRIVICKKGSSEESNGIDGKCYKADSSYGKGDTSGDGGYVIYDGTGNSCRAKDLDDNSTYHFEVIEYNGSCGKNTYDNTHKYHCNASTPQKDSDNDGTPDVDDEFPNDPYRAYSSIYPANSFGTLMYEDLWPGIGDYDFNDLVVDYSYTTITNSENNVVEVKYTFVTRAVGGALHNGFAFQLDGINSNKITSVSGSKATGAAWINLNANGTESGQSNANVLVFDDAYKLFPEIQGAYSFINTDPNATYMGTDTTRLTVTFIQNGTAPAGGTISQSAWQSSLFNPYLIVGQDRGKEVHLINRVPSAKVNILYFNKEQDKSSPSQNRYYTTDNNLPWALNVVNSIPFAKEKVDFSQAYLKFIQWAESGGTLFTDWFMNTAGYRDSSKLINK